MDKYKKIFEPCELGNGMVLKNRICYPNAMQSFMAGPEKSFDESLITDAAIFARSGASLMNYGHFGANGGGAIPADTKKYALDAFGKGDGYFDYRGEIFGSAPSFDYDIARTWNRVGQVAEVAHMYGTRMIVKLGAAFPKGVTLDGGDALAMFPKLKDDQLAGFSGLSKFIPKKESKFGVESIDAMKARCATKEQIEDSINDIVYMCRRYQMVGWDGMSLRGDRWGLDKSTNLRDDEYGGEIEGRGRFQLELYKKIKEYCGPNFLIEVAMPGEAPHGHDGNIPEGYTEEEFIRFMMMVEPYIDIVEIREKGGNGYQCLGYNSAPGVHPSLGYAKHLREAGFKKIIAVNGGYNDPDEMEAILEEGIVDLISTGRTFRAEPDFMNKLREQGSEAITPCLHCNKCHGIRNGTCGCAVNPKDAQHHRLPAIIKPKSDRSKKVAIIGGGLIGMRAACFAAERGHQVTIFEKDNKLGGKAAYYAPLYPGQWNMNRYLNWLNGELQRQGVTDIRLNCEADPEKIQEEGFDAVIACTGSHEKRPPIEGADAEGVYLTSDVYYGNVEPGQKVVIVGGGSSATEAAMYLASLGKDVTILTRQEVLMMGEWRMHGPHMTHQYVNPEKNYGGTGGCWIDRDNLKPVYFATTTKVSAHSVTYVKDGVETTLEADTVLVAGGSVPHTQEALRYAHCTSEFYMCGDDESDSTELLEGNRRAYGRVCLL